MNMTWTNHGNHSNSSSSRSKKGLALIEPGELGVDGVDAVLGEHPPPVHGERGRRARSCKPASAPSCDDARIDRGVVGASVPPGSPTKECGKKTCEHVALTSAPSWTSCRVAMFGCPSVADHVVGALVQDGQVPKGSR